MDDKGELLNLRRANAKNQGSDGAVALMDEKAHQQMRRLPRGRERDWAESADLHAIWCSISWKRTKWFSQALGYAAPGREQRSWK